MNINRERREGNDPAAVVLACWPKCEATKCEPPHASYTATHGGYK